MTCGGCGVDAVTSKVDQKPGDCILDPGAGSQQGELHLMST